MIKSVAIYCGSSNHVSNIYKNEAKKVGSLLAKHKIKLIYGGGNMGLMGILANSALDNGGDVYGVITEHLIDIEKKNKSLNNLKIVKTMHQRKMEMFNQADCFIIFPGGIGTLEEFFEVYSWKQLRLHKKPIYIYNLNNFWNELLSLIDRLIDEDFAGENMKEAYKVINNYDDLTKLLENNGQN